MGMLRGMGGEERRYGVDIACMHRYTDGLAD